MRLKIIAGNVVAILMVGLLSWVLVSGQIQALFVAEVDQQIANDHRLFGQRWRLQGYEFLEQAVNLAAESQTRDVFTALDEDRQRTRAFERANEIAESFARANRSQGGPPEIVLITDDRGMVIARNLDRHRMYEENLNPQLRTLSTVLERGEARSDVWRFTSGQEKLLQASLAPIRDPQGRVLGALVVGYDMSNGMASQAADLLGCEVAILVDERIYSSSMGADGMRSLREQLFGEGLSASTQAALSGEGDASDLWVATVGDQEYVGVTGPLPGSSSTQVAYAVLGSRTAQADKASGTSTILVITGLGLLFVLIYGFLIGNMFLKPLAEMEEGVLAVINGRTDLRLDIKSAELGGLAYSINQLVNVFTGTPEEDSDGRMSSPPEAWAGIEGGGGGGAAPAAGGGAAPAAPGGAAGAGGEEEDPELAAALEAEAEDAYYARIYAEYVAAKEAVGENVSNITQDRFVKRLQANEQSLVKKHGCRMVRFQVQTRGTQVNLRPVVIR